MATGHFVLSVFLMLSISVQTEANTERHVIYWNTAMTPGLSGKDFVVNVEIGQFMDILCPQHSLLGITNGPRELSTFDLYNVTENEFDQCKSGGRKNFIFTCDRPERENKLTIKFQLISPSPLGFRFQYCQDYYLLASPRSQRSKPGCHQDLTRLRISVACKEEPTTTTTSSTTTTTTTTTTSTTRKSEMSRLLQSNKDYSDFIRRLLHSEKQSVSVETNTESKDHYSSVVVPMIVRPNNVLNNDSESNKEPEVLASNGQNDDGRNSAQSPHSNLFNTKMYIFVFFAAVVSILISENVTRI
ncbi:uncharacterized protein LOC143452041 [Clavelina lepadiformis]|uniref:uncharacterized protein LOC143452041 n=1 Tax=Clavelina lepadiformis TaxID=159417 RepID=UPI004041FC88